MGPEKFDIKKFFLGLIEPKNTAKTFVFGFHAALMILIIFGIKFVVGWSSGTNKQKTNTTIRIESGASVGAISTSISPEQSNQSKKKYGLESEISSVDVDGVFVKYLNDNIVLGVGGRYNFLDKQSYPVIKMRYDF